MTCFVISGTVTDGEFTKLRYESVGSLPIHIYKVIKESRSSVSQMSEARLLKLITKTGGKFISRLTNDTKAISMYIYTKLFAHLKATATVLLDTHL